MKWTGIIALVSAVVLISTQGAYGLFANAGTSTANTFSAATTFPTPTSLPISAPTSFVPQVGNVVINEINWAGNNHGGGANDEWVELRNMTGQTIDLSGWFIENLGSSGSITIPSGKSIAPNGFFLISSKNDSASQINVVPDVIDNGIGLLDVGEILTLKTAGSVTIDTANETSGWFAGTSTGPIKSMERIDIPGDGTVGSNWQTATTHTNMDGAAATDEFGTPKAPNGL